MKRSIRNLIFITTAICCLVFTSYIIRCAHSSGAVISSALTGGAVGALDAVDGNSLADGMVAIAIVEGDGVYHYVLDATSGATESLPGIIAPDSNAGTKRWLLQASFAKTISADTTFHVATTGSDTDGNGTAGAPWATPMRAIEYLNGFYWDSNLVDITISVASGEFEIPATNKLHISHPSASSLSITGASSTKTSLGAVVAYGNDGTYDYFTVAGDKTAVLSAGDIVYLAVSPISDANKGAYKVHSVGYGAPNSTIKLHEDTDLPDSSDTPGSGFAYYLAFASETVFELTSTAADHVKMGPDTTLKSLSNLKIISDEEGSNVGLKITDKSRLIELANVVFENLSYAVQVEENSSITCSDDGYAVLCEKGVRARFGSDANIVGFVASHVPTPTMAVPGSGFEAGYNSSIVCTNCVSSKMLYGFYASNASSVFATNAVASGHDVGFKADQYSTVSAYNAYPAENIEDYDPTASLADFPVYGNIGAQIYGGTETESKAVLKEIQAEDATGLLLKDFSGALDATIGGANAPLHVALGSAGTDPTWISTIDTAIFESAAANNAAVQIFTAADKYGTLGFSDPGGRNAGAVAYNHTLDRMVFTTATVPRFTLDATELDSTVYISQKVNNGAPAAGDCDHDDERGRTVYDYDNHRLYVCGGASRGWDYLSLSD